MHQNALLNRESEPMRDQHIWFLSADIPPAQWLMIQAEDLIRDIVTDGHLAS